MEPIECPWCGEFTRPMPMRAHYVCGRCFRPLMDCCDGETACEVPEKKKENE